MRRYICTILLSIIFIALKAADFMLVGSVVDAVTHETLPMANVTITPSSAVLMADADGLFSVKLPSGSYRVTATYIGYTKYSVDVDLTSDRRITIAISPATSRLQEVVITAKEGEGMTTSSKIDRDAMSHLQPTSFSDLLELIPGNISQDPDMSGTNSIALRETGNLSATGAKTNNDDYAISSLGTQFLIDGAPMATDANLQGIPSADTSDPSAKRNATNRGVDMRTISTDNIESVEVIRGIPSAEYGNLTSGVVNVKRIRRSSPFTLRLKADEYSKLFSASKGFAIKNTRHIINTDAAYLDSKTDPRNSLENYKRINMAIRPTMHFLSNLGEISWAYGIDYTGSFDNQKTDPDLNYNKIDEYKSSYNKYTFISDLSVTLSNFIPIDIIDMNISANYVDDQMTRRKQVAPMRASVAPATLDDGVSDGVYLLSEYIADFKIVNRPFDLNLRFKAHGKASKGIVTYDYKAGAEWAYSKNFGEGQIYDLGRPLSASWTTRPRRYADIPAMQNLSGFIENELAINADSHKIQLRVGARAAGMPGLDRKYIMAGKAYIDPRVNAMWQLPQINISRPMHISISGGWGLTTKMPTIDYLYPQCHYNDLIQLNYYDTTHPQEWSRISLRTYKVDATNYDLKPARNRKWEVRLGASISNNRFSVTYFDERMTDGFRYTPVYAPYEFRKYDASAIDPSSLTAAPDISTIPYTDTKVLDGFRKPTNGSRIYKRGIEYQISTQRFMPLRTALIINGAWLKSTYSNSQMLYSAVNDVVGSQPVSDKYVGIYDTTEGRVNEQLNTNFMLDTQLPEWGLIFSTSVQCMWYVKTTRLIDNPIPYAYLSAEDGQVHQFIKENLSDPMLQYLVKTYNDDAYKPQRIPTAIYVNLKATKQIGQWMRISAFVNRIIDYLPDYKSNGMTVRRNADSYFGMEATFTI